MNGKLGFIAYALYHLIGFLTNLFYYGRLDFSFVDKANAPVGYISRGDLIRAQRDKIADDTIVEKGAWARLFGK